MKNWQRPAFAGLAAGLVVLTIAVGAAQAGPPGSWTRITAPIPSNSAEVSLARTDDGVLHVAWLRQQGQTYDIVHSAVSRAGRVVGSAVTIEGGWSSLTNPALAFPVAGQLVAFFEGIRSINPLEYYSGRFVYYAAAPPAGTGWLLSGARLSAGTNSGAPDIAAESVGNDVVLAWSSTIGVYAQVGLGGSPVELQSGLCCGYQPGIGIDAVSGTPVVGWFSNQPGSRGYFARDLRTGTERLLPGSVTRFNGQPQAIQIDQDVGITGRLGAPGVFLAYVSGYPSARFVVLSRFGTARPVLRIRAQDARLVGIAQGPQGRLWIFWSRGERLYATRTNRAATRIGEVESVRKPPGTGVRAIYKTAGDGRFGPLDLFAHAGRGTTLSHATWHTQVLPGLTVKAASRGTRITVTVTDAGEPVAGAKVRIGGRTLTTNRAGKATAQIVRAGTIKITASRAGYAPDTARVRRRR